VIFVVLIAQTASHVRRVDLFHDLSLKVCVVLVPVRDLNDLFNDKVLVFGANANVGQRIVVIYRLDHLPFFVMLLHLLFIIN